ncbi:hypothetical protein DDB_G0292492 [Dictyostelium discoideum AX4]|uniref:Uncharacterized protein n=1 Tax=Dictyostelium discoideum TaxID=44689 RepID=Q54D41_DICDI|nr:hypothetical protein DDB_G0292492 [Dictyostelium discoideum AX4]EAL61225.1 hypothetical protein DDB_G0292492 [Dictyostelium discoideum AX4]|eukprot:XP_629655.1 hypothetical protein DDB_G0292492 [Dictyostelium discoideum AX4]
MNTQSNNINNFKNVKTIELQINKDKFSLQSPWEVSDLISKEDYSEFINSINQILNNFSFLYTSIFTFTLSFIFFAMFKSSIFLAWLLEYTLIQEKIFQFNKTKSMYGVPIQFCLLLRKKEEINHFSGEHDDISLILSYDNDKNDEIYSIENNIQVNNNNNTFIEIDTCKINNNNCDINDNNIIKNNSITIDISNNNKIGESKA